MKIILSTLFFFADTGITFALDNIFGWAILGGFGVLWWLIQKDRQQRDANIKEDKDQRDSKDKEIRDRVKSLEDKYNNMALDIQQKISELREMVIKYNKS